MFKEVKEVDAHYWMADKCLKIICYAYDAAFIAENEDDQQSILFRFKKPLQSIT